MSDTEKKLMEYIWAQSHPITTAEIVQNMPKEKDWKQNTIITFLARLVGKGILKAVRIGKANHYEPCITEQEYRNFETKQFIKDVHKGSVFGLISSLCDTEDLTIEDIEDILKHLKE